MHDDAFVRPPICKKKSETNIVFLAEKVFSNVFQNKKKLFAKKEKGSIVPPTHASSSWKMVYRKQLSKLCQMHGVPSSGTKDEILARLVANETFVASLLSEKVHCSVRGREEKDDSGKKVSKTKLRCTEKATKSEKKKRVPNAYLQFCQEHRPDVVASGIKKQTDVFKKLGEMWSGDGSKSVALPEKGTRPYSKRDASPPRNGQTSSARTNASETSCSAGVVSSRPVSQLLSMPTVLPNNLYASTTRIPKEHIDLGIFHSVGECVHMNKKKYLYLVMP